MTQEISSISPGTSLSDYLATLKSREVASVIGAAAKGVIAIAAAMRPGSPAAGKLSGYTHSTNVQGETQAELDVFADKVMTEAFFGSGVVASLVSEEQENLLIGPNPTAPLVVAHDPLDGSSNIPFNIPVGTIFAASRRSPGADRAPTVQDYFQGEGALVCAGYGVYGIKTQFVFSVGAGVVDAVLDEAAGDFRIVSSQLTAKATGTIFSVNEGACSGWRKEVREFIDGLKLEGGFSGRYVGSLVSDFDRNLRKGGIYLYPDDPKNPRGKLRLLYECIPLAFIAAQSGGLSFDGERSCLAVIPKSIHERSPFYVGARDLVERLKGCFSARSTT